MPPMNPQALSQLYPESAGAPLTITKRFIYQSYFDSTLLETAQLTMGVATGIIPSTLASEQIPGYGLALAPWSQTPVAVSFKVGAKQAAGRPTILKPGMTIKPNGASRDGSNGQFSGFEWGLPYGWLGGGVASLVVLQAPGADVRWQGVPEIVFHRERLQIKASAGALTLNKNWPTRFPWSNALSGTIQQYGTPIIGVKPTRTVMRLRTTLAAPATMRLMLFDSDDFELSNLDVIPASVALNASFLDVIWPSWTTVAATRGGSTVTEYPVLELGNPMIRLGGDSASLALIAVDATLNNIYVDLERWGEI